jgi:CRP-like cAMP-binding protein/predicted GNAT family N-acyltransferase
MEIRFADTQDEREAVLRLGYEIYVEGMGFDDGADHQRRVFGSTEDRTARFLYAAEGGRMVGAMRLHWGADAPFTDEMVATFGLSRFLEVVDRQYVFLVSRFMIVPDLRAGTLAALLINNAVEFGLQHQGELAFCDCQPHLMPLYTSAGFRTYTGPVNHPAVGILVPLVLVSGDIAHAQRIGSPFLELFKRYEHGSRVPEQVAALLDAPGTKRVSSGKEESARLARELCALAQAGSARPGLFDGLPEEVVSRLIEQGFVINCAPGDRIIRQDVADRTLYLILEGCAEIRVGDETVDTASVGDVIGEMAFLMRSRRTANVYATTGGARILSLHESALRRLREAEPAHSSQLYENLARMLCAKILGRQQRYHHL